MILKEYFQRILSRYSKGVQSDDVRLVPPHIYNKMLSVRKLLLFQKSNKKQKISKWNLQVLKCIELIEVNPGDISCIPPRGCKILRSRHKLPKPIHSLAKNLITSVTSLDAQHIFSETNWESLKYQYANKYTGTLPKYFIRDSYLHITLKTDVNKMLVSAEGLFEDPIEAYNFPSGCECSDCDNCMAFEDYEFPLDGELEEPLIELTSVELIEEFNKNQQDITNDSKDGGEN